MLHIAIRNLDVRLAHSEIMIHCDMGEMECGFKCLRNNTQCSSFAVAMDTRCTGKACLLYSNSAINDLHFLQDNISTYYFMVCS